MKIKHILLVALSALALGLASIGGIGTVVADATGGHGGNAPAIAGAKPGVMGGSGASASMAGSKPGVAPGSNGALAGAKIGIAEGDNSPIAGGKVVGSDF
jgi:hypothetical protein